MINRFESPVFHSPALNFFPLENRWETNANLTLIGDAAHLMPPNGEGVNLAMLDALDLSNCLTNKQFTKLEHAIACYEKIMFDRAEPLCKEMIEGIKVLLFENRGLREEFNQNAQLKVGKECID